MSRPVDDREKAEAIVTAWQERLWQTPKIQGLLKELEAAAKAERCTKCAFAWAAPGRLLCWTCQRELRVPLVWSGVKIDGKWKEIGQPVKEKQHNHQQVQLPGVRIRCGCGVILSAESASLRCQKCQDWIDTRVLDQEHDESAQGRSK